MATGDSLIFPLELVGVEASRRGSRSWFFALLNPTSANIEGFEDWAATSGCVKFYCFAFELTTAGTVGHSKMKTNNAIESLI